MIVLGNWLKGLLIGTVAGMVFTAAILAVSESNSRPTHVQAERVERCYGGFLVYENMKTGDALYALEADGRTARRCPNEQL